MLPRRLSTRWVVTVGVVAGATVAVALAASTSPDPRAAGSIPRVQAMEGAIRDSPRPGEAIFRAAGLDAGDTVDGTVLVTNAGTQTGLFWLARTGLDDHLGTIGGRLSERLQLTVLDVSAPDLPLLVYTGGLEEMGARPLGFIAPGRSRIYSLAATLLGDPAAGASTGPSPYEGASTTLSLTWKAIAGEPPGGDAAVAARDATAPRLRLEVPRRQRLTETAAVTVLARCDERCDLSATGRLRDAGRALPAATVSGRASRGRTTSLRVKFGRAAREALRDSLAAGKAMRLRLSVTARDAAGNEAAETRRIWLRPGG